MKAIAMILILLSCCTGCITQPKREPVTGVFRIFPEGVEPRELTAEEMIAIVAEARERHAKD